MAATKNNVAEFERRRAELEASAAERRAAAEGRAAQLADLVVTIGANAGDEGKLFGSIGTRDIADAITAAGVAVEKSEVRLPNGAIREIGEFQIDIQLHSEITQSLTLKVVTE